MNTKKIIVVAFLSLCAFSKVIAQQVGFTYQAVAIDESKAQGFGRDSRGEILVNKDISLRFSIREGTEDGETKYQETHHTTTDIFGIFRLVIGRGLNVTGSNLKDLQWGETAYFLQVEIDLGNGFEFMGAEELLGVPYALNSNKQVLSIEQNTLSISNGNSVVLSDNDPTNELITGFSIQGTDLQISDAGGNRTVDLKDLAGGTLNEAEVDAFVSNNGYLTNEIQDLSLTGNNLSITNNAGATPISLTPYLDAAFRTTNSITSNEPGSFNTDDFVFGSPSLGSDGTSSHNSRMFFDKSKGAFRAGIEATVDWDDANVGFNSVAFNGAQASGPNSMAMGAASVASGSFSFTTGQNSVASGSSSTAIGNGATSSGSNSVAIGLSANATGVASTAIGHGARSFSFGEVAIGTQNTSYAPINTAAFNLGDRLFVIGNGNSSFSDALVMLKNGNTRLHGQLTIDADNVAGAGGDYTFPGQRGINGQVMITDGSGVLSWSTLPLSAFTTAAGVTSNAPGNYASDDFVFGSPQLADDNDPNHDKRMFFDKSKAAFRFGWTEDDSWNDVNVGYYSFAGGYNSRATGGVSFSFGWGSNAAAQSSFAAGQGNNSLAFYSTTLGIGCNVETNAVAGFAAGANSTVHGGGGVVIGTQLISRGVAETVFGKRNTDYTATNTPTDRLFVIGNQFSDVQPRSDALVMLRNGNTRLHGQLTIDADNVTGAGLEYRLPGQDGTAGHLMVTDGAGNVSWTNVISGDLTVAGIFTNPSDKKLKRNIKPLENSLSNISSLRGYHYNWNKITKQDTVALQTGLIAQELEVVFPELVKTDSDGFKSVNYIGLIPHLIEAIKELKTENENLKEQNNLSQEKVFDFETRLKQIEKLLLEKSLNTPTAKSN